MKHRTKHKLKAVIAAILCACLFTGCTFESVSTGEKKAALTVAEARKELDALLTTVNMTTVKNPKLDLNLSEIDESAALADIDTFALSVQGRGQINIEIGAATEISSVTSAGTEDWLLAVAKNFNQEKHEIDGKTVSVSVRTITSGEILTYMRAGAWQPHAAVFSNDAWGRMCEASGLKIELVESRIAGNTAGILISKEAHDKVSQTYGEVTFDTVIQAAVDGLIIFGMTNPYTSSTGLNGLAGTLEVFDPSDPLSATAAQSLREYQKTAPAAAYTTKELCTKAEKGLVDAMVMEEQAYINSPDLSNYIYIPFGIRHDHPVYSFGWDTPEEKKAVEMFAQYCLSDENQKLATSKGFNRHDDYVGGKGLTGQQYLTAQSLWKQNKTGGRATAAVFIVDVSGSMKGDPLASLQDSVIAALPYIGSENYVGLISYATDVTINVSMLEYGDPDDKEKVTGVKPFDDRQRAYFSGEVKNLVGSGNTATYDAVLAGLDMINKAQAIDPEAVPMIILLTDGDRNVGYTLNRITSIVEGMRVPVYCIAYNYKGDNLETLSGINEASTVKADSDNVVTQLRNLFTTQL